MLQNAVKEILGSGISDHTFTITPMDSKTGIRCTNEDGGSFDIGYDPERKEIYVDRSNCWYEIESTSRHAASFDARENSFEIRVIIDTGSVELFVAGGRLSITDLLLPSGSTWSTTPF